MEGKLWEVNISFSIWAEDDDKALGAVRRGIGSVGEYVGWTWTSTKAVDLGKTNG